LDFFFAGSVEGKTARLPGLRLSGQCVLIQTTVSGFDDFPAYCEAQIPNLPFASGPLTLAPAAVSFTMNACCNATWAEVFPLNATVATNVGYIYVQSNNHSNVATNVPGTTVSGVIRCDTSFSTGTAILSGTAGTYSNFTEEPLYHQTTGGDALLDPLFALFYYLGHGNTAHLFADESTQAGVIRALGFVGITDNNQTQLYIQPSAEDMATGFWRGVSYSVAGLGLLSRSNDTSYAATQSGQTAVYVRERDFAAGAYALLAIWLLLLVVITARSFRPTFGGSFDSYITAKLVLDKPGLVESSSGDLAANENLREPFARVGRDERGRIVVAEQ